MLFRKSRKSGDFESQLAFLESELESTREEQQTPRRVEQQWRGGDLAAWIYLGMSLLILMFVVLLVGIRTMTRTRLITLHTNVSSSQNSIYTSRTQL